MSPAFLSSHDPADGSVVASVPVSTLADITHAVATARAALPGWARDPAPRAAVLQRLADLLKAESLPLARLIARETGKVLWEAQLEVAAMANKCALAQRALAERRTPTTSPAGSVTYRPHGVAAILGPFNFPGHLPLGHLAPALLAGNTALLKPSEKTPGVGLRLAELLHLAGLPPGVLHVLQGGPDVASTLLDTDIDAVLFTGSYAVGTHILARLAPRPGVLTALEMGGNNPLIAWDLPSPPHPAFHAAVLCILQSAFATAGQRCSCARRLILPRNHPLLPALLTAAQALHVGLPFDDPAPFYACLIDDHAVEATFAAQHHLARQGDLLLEARRSPRSPRLLSPAIVRVQPPIGPPDDTTDTETFGPLLQVIEAESFDHALALANHTRYGLVSGLLTDNPALWEPFRTTARAGVLTLNRPTTGASSELPFGGIGRSGNHRPSAYFAADYCDYPVAEMTTPHLRVTTPLPPGITL